MIVRIFAVILFAVITSAGAAANDAVDLDSLDHHDGFIDFYWDAETGRVLLNIARLDEAFIYQASLARGIGSNDIGLDRGQLGRGKLVRFVQIGPKVLLLEDNPVFRANSANSDEQKAIEESFARSVIWGFEDLDAADNTTLIDATEFFLSDTHGVSTRLSEGEEGAYNVDPSRSAIFLPRTKAFPDNTEVEAIVTLVGKPTGEYLASVVPDATAVTVHIHHSFIRLPDDNYEPLPYDPRAGVIGLRYDIGGFADYASAIGDKLMQDYGRRHRLRKRDPSAKISEAVAPIIYYLDRGAPEPVRSALLDGARWWNQAFEAAGYKDAFRVEMLPSGVDPMDVRYNVIQWVHRSTRGWSYGDSIIDPRSGEILKGHVSLGSLRVRQDYLIAEGLLAPYTDGEVPGEMLDMALARIRQLAAHEVGHTIGMEHNFAASTQDRASVMDYPFPLIKVTDTNQLDLSDAYDDKIGAWDKRTVLYAYQDFVAGVDRNAARRKIMDDTIAAGFRYVADTDARAVSTAHPKGNLWDNGDDAVVELENLLRVRRIALQNMSQNNIRVGRSLATLEEVMVPIYLLHRYQIQAVGKLIAGESYVYNMRGDAQPLAQAVTEAVQLQAISALVATLAPPVLRLPDALLAKISPRPPNNPKSRETFGGRTGLIFDALAPAASAVELTLNVLLDPVRGARMVRTDSPGFVTLTQSLLDATWYEKTAGGLTGAIQRQTNLQVLYGLLRLALDTNVDADVRAIALQSLGVLDRWLSRQSPRDVTMRAHFDFARFEMNRLRNDPSHMEFVVPAPVPPGSPIGTSY
jgi:hypothetical protein